MTQRLSGPGRRLICVARRAWIGNLVFVRHRRRDEGKRVSAHLDVQQRRLNFGHVT